MINLKNTLEFAQSVALDAGRFLLDHQPQVSILADKGKQNIVTTADLKAESILVSAIHNNYPEHEIFSEEQGSNRNVSPYRWIIDPLDGTKEYLRDLPFWNTNLTLEFNRKPVLTVIYKPISQSLISCALDVGIFDNNRQVFPSLVKQLDQAHVYVYIPSGGSYGQPDPKTWHRLEVLASQVQRLRGSAEEAISIAWTGCGKIEAAVNFSRFPKWYDFVAGFTIARQSKLVISDLKGNLINKEGNYDGYIVAGKKIHSEILAIISEV